MRCASCEQYNEVPERFAVRAPAAAPRTVEEGLAPAGITPLGYYWDCRFCGARHVMRGADIVRVISWTARAIPD